MNIPQNFWKASVAAVILLVVFLAVISVKELKSLSDSDPIYNTISVSGKGEVVTIPDIATFSFSVTETGKTVAEAQTKATDRANAALKAVRDAGIEDKDIQTTSYAINPHYEYQEGVCTMIYPSTCKPGKSVLTGYDVSQSIQVKIRDLKKAGDIFTSIGALGVKDVNGLSFSIDNVDTIKAQARASAIADAQAKAEVLSKQLGVRLVKIVSYYDNSDQPVYYAREGMGGDMMSAKTMSVAAAPEIPTGEQKVTSNVTITYEIK